MKQKYKMTAAAVSDFVRIDSSRQNCVRDASFVVDYAKFSADTCSNNRVIAVKLNFKMAATTILDFVKNVKMFSGRKF